MLWFKQLDALVEFGRLSTPLCLYCMEFTPQGFVIGKNLLGRN